MSELPPYPLIEFGLTIGTWDLWDVAYPDTGCETGIAIPVGAGKEVLAPPVSITMQFADRRIERVPSWRGTVELDGHRFRVEVIAVGSTYLIGREVLDELEICFEFGRRVRLRFKGE